VRCDILGAEGSERSEGVIVVPGKLEADFGNARTAAPGIQAGGVLENMLEYARRHQREYDFIIALGQDYLSYLLQPYFDTPFLLIPNVCKSTPATDRLLLRRYLENRESVGFLTRSQAACILGDQQSHEDATVLWEPLNIDQYDHDVEVDATEIFWAGRIYADKGVLEVAEVCRALGRRLTVAGDISDRVVYDALMAQHDVVYAGILHRSEMGRRIARSPVFLQLQSPGCLEAFGRTTAEALLSGCPVIAFESGANSELVEHGKDGYIVGSRAEAIDAFPEAMKLDRAQIKTRAQSKFHPRHHADNLLRWFEKLQAPAAGSGESPIHDVLTNNVPSVTPVRPPLG
jgi:glycosyltransferase involved in cell wall biosynthesis